MNLTRPLGVVGDAPEQPRQCSSRGRGGPHGRKSFKGKAHANEVDGIANTVKMYNEEMNVDTTY